MSDPCDNHWDHVVLLLHLDDDTYLDSSTSAHTVTPSPNSANVPIDTSDKVFGAGSCTFPYGASTLVIPNHVDFDFGAGDWTIEARLKYPATAVGNISPVFNTRPVGSGGTPPFYLYVGADGRMHFLAYGTDTAVLFNPVDIVCPTDTWFSIAIVRSGDTLLMFEDGVLLTSASAATAGMALAVTAEDLKIGGSESEGHTWHGHIDEVRITKGIARYTADYTVADAAFPESQCGVVLPDGTIFVYGSFVPSSEFRALEMDRLGTIKPHIYAPIANRTVRTRS